MPSPITALISASLNQPASNWQQCLTDIIAAFDCTTGTIHILDERTHLLKLQAQQGLPDFLIPKMAEIPIGKAWPVLSPNAASR